jgi:hypothetical protein
MPKQCRQMRGWIALPSFPPEITSKNWIETEVSSLLGNIHFRAV